jgi:Uma2 family endonuclease
MIESGVLTENDPVELLEGILVFKMPKKPSHPMAVRLLISVFDDLLPPGWHFRPQEPLTLEDGEPEPDGAVVRGGPRDYPDRHPGPADVALVIEVADTTLDRDRGIKLRSYARAGITVYWILDLVGRRVEVYTDPDTGAPQPAYRNRQVVGADASVPLDLRGERVGEIPVESILA